MAFAHISGAGALLANGLIVANLAGAALVRIFPHKATLPPSAADGRAAAVAMIVIVMAEPKVPFARHHDGFAGHVRNLNGHSPRGLAWFAGPHIAALHTSFLHTMPFGAAHIFHHGFAYRSARGVAAFAVTSLAHRLAAGLVAIMAVLLGDAMLHHVAGLVAVLFVAWLATRVNAFLVAGFAHLLADRAMAFFVASLVNRFAARFAHCLVAAFIYRPVHAIVAFFHHRLVNRAAHWALFGLPASLLALLVAGSFFVAPASFANRLHDRFANCLMANVEPLFHHRVINQPIRTARLRLIGGKAPLRIATWGAVATSVLGAAAMRSQRGGSGPQ
jgi:hypothetical protein